MDAECSRLAQTSGNRWLSCRTTSDWQRLRRPGPVDPLVEFAQVCWLNVQLHDDDIAERQGLPSADARARQVRLMADSYGLGPRDRALLVDTMITYAVHDAADQAIQVPVTPRTTDPSSLWGLAWRTRAAAWMLRNRTLLNRALSWPCVAGGVPASWAAIVPKPNPAKTISCSASLRPRAP